MGIEKTGGTRIEAEPKSHINCLELIHGCKFSAVGKVTVYIYIYLYNATIFNCLYSMGGTHSIECNSAAKDIWQLCIERERSVFLQLSSQGRITLRLTWSLEFLLIIRGGIAKTRHVSTTYKYLVEPLFDPFFSKLNAQVSCYASWRPDPNPFQLHALGNNFSVLVPYLV